MQSPFSKLLILFLFFIPSVNLSAQYKFQRNFAELFFSNGVQTMDGGYIVSGIATGLGAGSDDVFLLKLNPFGKREWLKTYGGSNKDWGSMVQPTKDGGYIIAGTTWSFGLPIDIYLIKTDFNGDTLWTRAYGTNNVDFGYSVCQTSDSGFIVCGHTRASLNNDDVYLLKTDKMGMMQWAKTYGGMLSEQSYSVIQSSDSGYVLTGFTNSFGVPGEGNVFLIKTNSMGDTLWTKTYGGNDEDDGQVVIQTGDGGYMIGAITFSFGSGDFDYYLIKTDALGDTLWTKTYGSNLEDYLLSINQTDDGGYVVSGGSWIFTGSTGNFDNNTLLINSAGDTIWTRSFGKPVYDDYGMSVQQTNDNGFIVFNGITFLTPQGNRQNFLIKTDSDGNTKCENAFIPFSIGIPPTQVIGENWIISSIGTEKKVATLVNDTIVSDSVLCEQCGSVTISFDETLCKGEKDSISTTSSISSEYIWSPLSDIDCSGCPNPVAQPDSSTYYFVTITDVNGCISYDSIFIKVDSCESEIIIPNIFSPNGDGLNDQWLIKGIGSVGWELHIFNRWGELIYFTKTPSERFWNGRTFTGEEVPTGVYYYTLNNQEIRSNRNGFLQLVK